MKPEQMVLKTINLLYLFLFISMMTSCSGGNGIQTAEDVGLPPSLAGESEADVAVVRLSQEQAEDLQIQLYTVREEVISYPVSVPGIIAPAPDQIAVLSTPLNGRVRNIFAHEGEEVRRGDPLLEIESLEFAELAAGYLEAQAEKTYLDQQVIRLSSLTDQRISPRSTLDRARADLARAEARVRAAAARLRAVGIDERQLEGMDETGSDRGAVLTLTAAIDGKINQHLIDPGQAVHANDMLLDIINSSEVLARGFADPDDLPGLRVGAGAVISDRGEGSRVSVESEITTIQPGLDQENRSVIVNSIVQTRNQWPVIGQSVEITYEAVTPAAVIAVPLSAVQYEGENARVFVKRDDLTYESRSVTIERTLGDRVILSSGLEAEDEVAVTQVFSLKALGKFEQYAAE